MFAYHYLLMQINLGRNRPAVSLGVFCGNLAASMEHLFASQAARQQSCGWQESRGSGPSAAWGSGPSRAHPLPPRMEGRLALRTPCRRQGAGAFVPTLLGPRAAAGVRGSVWPGSGEKPVSLQPAWA